MSLIIGAVLYANLLRTPQEPYQANIFPAASMAIFFPGTMVADPIALTTRDPATDIHQAGDYMNRYHWTGYAKNGSRCELTYYKYHSTAKFRPAVGQMAESYFGILALMRESEKHNPESLKKFDEDFSKRFFGRKVTKLTVDGYDAVMDSHTDIRRDQARRILAWGDNKERWVLDVLGEKASAGGEKLVEDVLSKKVRLILEPKHTPTMRLTLQFFTDLKLALGLPGSPTAEYIALDEKATGCKQQLFSELELKGGFKFLLVNKNYTDKAKVIDTKEMAAYHKRAFGFPGITLMSSNEVPYVVGPWRGTALYAKYEYDGKSWSGVYLCLGQPGRELLISVNVTDFAGGKAKVDEVVKSISAFKT
jgi:hypothetical protein